MNYKIGILAFGSLIDNPGDEIAKATIAHQNCVTPFKVEFARISTKRSYTPTLLPVDDSAIGRSVNAKILILREDITIKQATDMLWRREVNKMGSENGYIEKPNPTSEQLQIRNSDKFPEFEHVIYAYFSLQEKYLNLTSIQLAKYAYDSILLEAGEQKRDGIRYLLSAKKSGTITQLSEEYEFALLKLTGTKTLEEAIVKMDGERERLKNIRQNIPIVK